MHLKPVAFLEFEYIYILYIVGLNIYVVGSSWTFSKGV